MIGLTLSEGRVLNRHELVENMMANPAALFRVTMRLDIRRFKEFVLLNCFMFSLLLSQTLQKYG